jgi:hypothetical protein
MYKIARAGDLSTIAQSFKNNLSFFVIGGGERGGAGRVPQAMDFDF